MLSWAQIYEVIRSSSLSWAQIYEIMHGRKPTPEELERSRQSALMVLGELELKLSDSQDIWDELENNERS